MQSLMPYWLLSDALSWEYLSLLSLEVAWKIKRTLWGLREDSKALKFAGSCNSEMYGNCLARESIHKHGNCMSPDWHLFWHKPLAISGASDCGTLIEAFTIKADRWRLPGPMQHFKELSIHDIWEGLFFQSKLTSSLFMCYDNPILALWHDDV